ncbi:hypothetical protein CSC18_1395 [Klebsiella aerogenes]|nr:hypothetical protein CSC18_1395 [Klebsiella aerogenes]
MHESAPQPKLCKNSPITVFLAAVFYKIDDFYEKRLHQNASGV